MSDIHAANAVVNTFTPILDVDTSGVFVRLTPSTIFRLKDTPFSRWYLKARFAHLNATPAGTAWFKQIPLESPSTTLMNFEPRNYQKIGIDRLALDPMSLFFDMGLGKTFMVLFYAMYLFEHKDKNFFLVVCPNSLIGEWQEQIATHIKADVFPQIFVLHGSNRNKEAAKLKVADSSRPIFAITTYHTLKTVSEKISMLPFSMFIADESSRIRYMSSAITKAAHNLRAKWPNACCVPLSGTPSTTKIEGYYSMFEFCWPGSTGFSNVFMFRKHFEIQKRFMITKINGKDKHIYYEKKEEWLNRNYPEGSTQTYAELGYSFSPSPRRANELPIIRVYDKTDGVQNLPQLQQMTERLAYSKQKEEVLTELPPKTYIVRTVEMCEEQRAAYHEVITTNRTVLENTVFSFNNMSSPHCKLHQIANGYLKNGDTLYWFPEQPKIDALDDLLDGAENEKVIIWVPFIPLLTRLEQHIRETRKEDVISIHGGVSVPKRQELIARFKDKNGVTRMLGNPAAAGEGLNLFMSHLQIFYTNWVRPDQRNQAEDRQHRMGQERGVMIYDLITRGTIEKKIHNDLKKKTEIEQTILSPQELLGVCQ